jgi:hypothetical protein
MQVRPGGLTREELQRALGVKPQDKSSQYRGVSRKKGKWEAKLMVNNVWAFRGGCLAAGAQGVCACGAAARWRAAPPASAAQRPCAPLACISPSPFLPPPRTRLNAELFDTEAAAARAYDAAVLRLKSRDAKLYLNFPDSTDAAAPAALERGMHNLVLASSSSNLDLGGSAAGGADRQAGSASELAGEAEFDSSSSLSLAASLEAGVARPEASAAAVGGSLMPLGQSVPLRPARQEGGPAEAAQQQLLLMQLQQALVQQQQQQQQQQQGQGQQGQQHQGQQQQ